MKYRGQAGFTLVELLIAIALLGSLTIVAYAGVRFGTVSWRLAERHRAVDDDQRAVARVLQYAITGAYPRFASASFADRAVAFAGSDTTLLLVAPLPAAIEAGVMAQQRFFVDMTAAGPTLMMGWRLDLPSASGGVLPEHLVPLAAPVSAVRFAYFGVIGSGQAPAWFGQWRGLANLPGLVRAQVWRNSTAAAPWLDIVTETRTTTSTACVYDPSDVNCRRVR